MKRRFLPVLAIAVFGLIAAQKVFLPSAIPNEERHENEKINLALRQVGHLLLAAVGNDTSRIPPVKQLSDNEYILRLEDDFNYDTLPAILSQVLEGYGIGNHYRVAIKNCQTDSLILGFDRKATEYMEVACRGREKQAGCSDISVVFETNKKEVFSSKYFIFSLLFFLILLWVQYLLNKKVKAPQEASTGSGEKIPDATDHLLPIGNSFLDSQNQSFETNGSKKELTFREAKLLHFFVVHPNQVLERENILSNVWEDEGVIVGRSLDVFVSRLRKIIQADPSIQIKNVHGVGYKLEVTNSALAI